MAETGRLIAEAPSDLGINAATLAGRASRARRAEALLLLRATVAALIAVLVPVQAAGRPKADMGEEASRRRGRSGK